MNFFLGTALKHLIEERDRLPKDKTYANILLSLDELNALIEKGTQADDLTTRVSTTFKSLTFALKEINDCLRKRGLIIRLFTNETFGLTDVRICCVCDERAHTGK